MTQRISTFSLHSAIGAAAIAIATPGAHAATFLVDFYTTSDGSGFVGGASAWNTIDEDEDIEGMNYPVLHDSTGSTTAGVTLHSTGFLQTNPNTADAIFNNATGGPSWVTTDGMLDLTGAAQDAFWTDNNGATANASFTLELENLPESQVTLDLFSSRRSGSAIGFFDYSVDGGMNWTGFSVLEKDGTLSTDARWDGINTQTTPFRSSTDGNDEARYLSASFTAPTGSLLIRATDTDTNSQFTVLNAFRVTTVPEPSTVMLSMVGIGALMLGRRRQH